MNTDICPTITASTAEEYRAQIERVVHFSRRLHIDIADGEFTPNKLLDINEVWWPGGMTADLHIMYKRPQDILDYAIALHPQLIIFQAESQAKFIDLVNKVKSHGIEVGLALLPETKIETIKPALALVDHVLIFSGNLGHQGGSVADLNLLDKAKEVRGINPLIEIGWDGGINQGNAKQIAQSEVDVLNVGGYIHHSDDPEDNYKRLVALVEGNA